MLHLFYCEAVLRLTTKSCRNRPPNVTSWIHPRVYHMRFTQKCKFQNCNLYHCIEKVQAQVFCLFQVLKEIKIKSYEELVPNDLSAGIIGPNEYKCLGVIYGKKCLPSQDRWLATFSRIAKSFMRYGGRDR